MQCPHCQTQNRQGAQFCRKCGIRFDAVCPACGAFTERREHDCGASTSPAGGWRWMTNDAVNLVATLVGAATALISSHALAGA